LFSVAAPGIPSSAWISFGSQASQSPTFVLMKKSRSNWERPVTELQANPDRCSEARERFADQITRFGADLGTVRTRFTGAELRTGALSKYKVRMVQFVSGALRLQDLH
jgi:hypothetical protein